MTESTSPPWSPNEIRENARKELSLENDAKLLKFMENISTNIIDRATATNTNIEGLVSNINRTSIALDNVANRLSSLSHYKFVENRVYDDDNDAKQTSKTNFTTEKSQKEYNPVETLKTIIKNNIQMLNTCYEKVSVDLDDSDDEAEQIKSIVYRPKNPYETRPIPHLIGSKEWNEKWHIGLYDSDESFSENENEEFSDASESVSLPSNGPAYSESGSSAWSLNKNTKMYQNKINQNYSISSDDEEEDTSTTPSKTSNDHKKDTYPNKHPANIQIPIPEQRFYVHQPKEKGLFDDSSNSDSENKKSFIHKTQVLEKKIQVLPKHPPNKQFSNIFNNEPPELDVVEEQQPKVNQTSSQLFFDTDDDETIIEKKQPNYQSNKSNSIVQPPPKVAVINTNLPKKTINLFDDDVYDEYLQELDQNQNNTEPIKKVNLFDDDSCGSDIEPASNNKKTIKSTEKKKNVDDFKVPISKPENKVTTTSGLFDDEEDLFANIVHSKKPVKTNMFKITNLFDDDPPEDNFDELFGKSIKTSSNNTENDNNKPSNSPNNISAINTLISNKSHELKADISTGAFDPTVSDNKLFSDDNLNISVPKTSTNLFDDDTIEDDDDFFEKIKRNRMNNSKLLVPAASNLSSAVRNVEVSDSRLKTNLFDEEENDEFDIKFKPTISDKIITEPYNSKVKEISNSDNYSLNIDSGSNMFDKPINEANVDNILEENVKEDTKKAIAEQLFTHKSSRDEEEVVEQFSSVQTETETEKSSKSDMENAIAPHSTADSILLNKPSFLFSDDNDSVEEDELFAPINKLKDEIKNKVPNVSDKIEETDKENKPEVFSNKVTESIIKEPKSSSLLSEAALFGDKLPTENNYLPYSEELPPNDESPEIFKNPSQNEEETIEKIFEKPINLPTPSSIFSTSLFDDSPPEDCDIFTTSPIKSYRNDADSEIFGNASEKPYPISIGQTSSNYVSAIFQDTMPPEDNEILYDNKEVESIVKPQIKSIFYDDISETIAGQNMTSKGSFLFNDEPPPDSCDINDNSMLDNESVADYELPPTPSEIAISKNSQLEFVSSEKAVSVSDLIKQASVITTSSTVNKVDTAVAPKKMIPTNLNINIAALLPGAKRPTPSLQKPADTNNDQKLDNTDGITNSKVINEKNSMEEISTQGSNVDNNSSEQVNPKRLTSFNKTRAKILTKRRPSTRKGRQENYAKSLLIHESSSSETIDEITQSNLLPSIPKEITPKVEKAPDHVLQNNMKFKGMRGFNTIDFNFPNAKNKLTKSEIDSKSLEVSSQHHINAEIITSVSQGAEIPNKQDWLIHASSNIENIVKKPNQASNEPKKKPADISFFDDDEDASDSDDLFATKFNVPIKNIPNIKKSIEPIPKTNISKIPNATENNQEIFKKVKIYKKQPVKNMNPAEPSPSILTNSNNIFAPADGKEQKTKANIQNSSGIFSSDDDDDDLFGASSSSKKNVTSGSNKVVQKTTPKNVESTKKVLNISTKTSLFDDVDDDDDLFGGGNNAHTTNKAQLGIKINQNRGAIPKKIISKTEQLPTDITGNDPLADLLDR